MTEQTAILDCGHVASPHADFTTGYGVTPGGKKHCYACCAVQDQADMIETGAATLYLAKGVADRWEVTNWPGSLRFPARYVKTSRYGGGFDSQRRDAWFTGPDGKEWHAINRGDMQIARCRRLKVQPR